MAQLSSLVIPLVTAFWILFNLTVVHAQPGPDKASILLDLLKHSRQELKQQQQPDHQTSPLQQQQPRSKQQFWSNKTQEPGLLRQSGQAIPISIPIIIPIKRRRPDPLFAYPVPPWYLYYWLMEHHN